MSGLLDGGALGSLLAGAMAPLYASGKLYKTTLLDNDKGGWTPSSVTYDIKAQENLLSEAARVAAGYTAKEAQIIVLRPGLSVEPTTDDKILLLGVVYAVKRVESDPARSHWLCRCERTALSPDEVLSS